MMKVQQDKYILSVVARTRWLKKGPWAEDGASRRRCHGINKQVQKQSLRLFIAAEPKHHL